MAEYGINVPVIYTPQNVTLPSLTPSPSVRVLSYATGYMITNSLNITQICIPTKFHGNSETQNMDRSTFVMRYKQHGGLYISVYFFGPMGLLPITVFRFLCDLGIYRLKAFYSC